MDLGRKEYVSTQHPGRDQADAYHALQTMCAFSQPRAHRTAGAEQRSGNKELKSFTFAVICCCARSLTLSQEDIESTDNP